MAENESANLAAADDQFTDDAPPFEGGSSDEPGSVEVGLDEILDEPGPQPKATESKPKGGAGAQAEDESSGPPKGTEPAPEDEAEAEEGEPAGEESAEPDAEARPKWDKEQQRLQQELANANKRLAALEEAAKGRTEPEASVESPAWEGEIPPLLTADDKQAIDDGTADYTVQRKLAERQEYDSFRLTVLESQRSQEAATVEMNRILDEVCAEVGEKHRNGIVAGLRKLRQEEGEDYLPDRRTTRAHTLAIGLALEKADRPKAGVPKTQPKEQPKSKPDTGARGAPVADIDGEPAGDRPMDYLRWAERKHARLNKAQTG